MPPYPTTEPRNLSRRRLLLAGAGLGAGMMLGTLPFPIAAQRLVAAEAGFDEFVRLSAQLTGRDDLLPAQGRVAFEALSSRFPGFEDGLAQLAGFMETQDVEVSRLQAVLDEAGAEFAWIPRQIVSAWYLGVVGAVEQPADAEAGLVPLSAIEGTEPMRAAGQPTDLVFGVLRAASRS